jgi:hypothetical protein
VFLRQTFGLVPEQFHHAATDGAIIDTSAADMPWMRAR